LIKTNHEHLLQKHIQLRGRVAGREFKEGSEREGEREGRKNN